MILEILGCPTCANNFKDGANAAGNAILFMLVLIVPLLIGVASLLIRIARRERAALEPELQDDFDPKNFPNPHG